MKVTIEKEKYPSIMDNLADTNNADFYGWLYVDKKRCGVVWKYRKDGRYSFVEDFDRRKHSKENHPAWIIEKTISTLKTSVMEYYLNNGNEVM